jgi:hypothetical protein
MSKNATKKIKRVAGVDVSTSKLEERVVAIFRPTAGEGIVAAKCGALTECGINTSGCQKLNHCGINFA